MRVALLCSCLLACTPPTRPATAPTPAPSAFGCRGDPAPVDPPAAPVTPGRLEVTRSASGVKIIAEDVSASRLAVRVGEALGVETHIDEGLEHVVVSLYAPDISVEALAERLSPRAIEISRSQWQQHHILLVQNSDRWGGTARHPDLAPIQSRVMEPRLDMTAEQMASLYCRTFATPVGAAQVIGRRVLVMDRSTVVDQFEAMVHRLDERAQ